MPNRSYQSLRLANGHTLGYAIYGAASGPVLLYFHGHPGSRLESRLLAEAARAASVRVIGLDRPGLGLSSYAPTRRLIDWPGVVSELLDVLTVPHCAVVGFSGGGPYALACATALPDRIQGCGVVSGVGRPGPLLSFLAQWVPWIALPLMRGLFRTDAAAHKNLLSAARRWPVPDRVALDRSGVSETMAAALAEAFLQGVRGAAYDGMLLGRPWGFDVRTLAQLKVHLWHGALDQEIPLTQALAVAGQLPQCERHIDRNTGHLSTLVEHAPDIVQTLTAWR